MEVSCVLDIALFVVLLTNIFVCPYTKVEESFNLQATHDIMYHRFNISQYDHVKFPGVVPRTFIGPLVIALLSSPFMIILNLTNLSKICSQYLARAVLGICSLSAFRAYQRGVSQKFGATVGNFVAIITMTQFHFMFYISRPLPNIFALILVLLAFYFWLTGNQALFIWCSAYSIIIFRAELALLMGIIFLYELYHQRIPFLTAFLHAASAGITSLVLTLSVDSFFWQRFCWPEGEVFWYNIFLNKSSNWGTSPFLWYFYSALPRSLSLFTPFLVIYGLKHDKRTRVIFSMPMAFVFLFSFLPHKELRFVFYIIPLLNTVAAVGANSIYKNIFKWKIETQAIFTALTLGGLLSNTVFSNILLYTSSANYPGGLAFTRLHKHLESSTTPVNVHICNYAAQTGVSRFGELRLDWSYNKTENLEGSPSLLSSFTHLLVEAPCMNRTFDNTHHVLDEILGFHKILPQTTNTFPYFSLIQFKPRLCILERKTWKEKGL